ncbi:hypothetical protein [Evansella tamaricis]|uniref:Uncharacterized protein n=1 Tax=Evansella tamaricis TaxID=2069301 RepID=A0ABS6JBI6_9BACI|nr:hypothetical protein [Evansella tamaricis]MBU9711044.1 hypothetical protein [Evansella tamaricis]
MDLRLNATGVDIVEYLKGVFDPYTDNMAIYINFQNKITIDCLIYKANEVVSDLEGLNCS